MTKSMQGWSNSEYFNLYDFNSVQFTEREQDQATCRSHEKERCLLLEPDASALPKTKFFSLHQKKL